jgi:hypothetical protein
MAPFLLSPADMLNPRTLVGVMAPLVGVVGCSSSEPASTSSSACYDNLIASAQSCVPAATAIGVLNSAGTNCTYASGDQVTFAPPEAEGISNFVLNDSAGKLCMSYESADGGFTLQTALGTAVKSSTGRVTCPGGAEYSGATPAGSVSSYGGSAASFTLVTGDGGFAIFNCTST